MKDDAFFAAVDALPAADDDPEGFLLARAMIEDILARDEVFLEMNP